MHLSHRSIFTHKSNAQTKIDLKRRIVCVCVYVYVCAMYASSSRKCFIWTISQLKIHVFQKCVHCIFRHYILLNTQTVIKIKLECAWILSLFLKKNSGLFSAKFVFRRHASAFYFCHIFYRRYKCSDKYSKSHHVFFRFEFGRLFFAIHMQYAGLFNDFSALLLTFLFWRCVLWVCECAQHHKCGMNLPPHSYDVTYFNTCTYYSKCTMWVRA